MNRSLRIVAVLAALVLPALVWAQSRETQVRTVRGTVVDKQSNPMSGGIVYLKNLKTQVIRTYISDDAGLYRFSGLDPNVDYELHAETKDLTSTTRTISSFDSRKDIVLIIKIDKPKSGKQ
ncbi:MAG: carboxypeptidase-like regulatory domain-containing protein [Bryobacteraceae bacterium]